MEVMAITTKSLSPYLKPTVLLIGGQKKSQCYLKSSSCEEQYEEGMQWMLLGASESKAPHKSNKEKVESKFCIHTIQIIQYVSHDTVKLFSQFPIIIFHWVNTVNFEASVKKFILGRRLKGLNSNLPIFITFFF